jgi:hypothetical protein
MVVVLVVVVVVVVVVLVVVVVMVVVVAAAVDNLDGIGSVLRAHVNTCLRECEHSETQRMKTCAPHSAHT